ncbi:ATP-binding protein [Niabella sp.]|uniref:ATP-binding protein n=1 Tax=Niabella sp. TaxID=1962976 RepID=UPI00260BFB61|nr:ATP-binding protein [Niabella sp.]
MYPRYMAGPVKEALEDTSVILINGARQTGKSTFCRQLMEQEVFNGRFVTLDDATTLMAAQTDPTGFLLDLGEQVIIDEIQRAPELFLPIKKLVDENRKERRYILTGSADVMTLPKMADSLAGRIEVHKLWPLSQTELRQSTPVFLQTLLQPAGDYRNSKTNWTDTVQAIKTGGYPEAVARATEMRRDRWFQAYLAAILQKDIRELSNIEGLTQLPNILHLLATRAGSTINFSDIARLAGIKNTTFQRYMALLEHIFLLIRLPAWTPNTEGQFVKSPKVLLNDTGLLCHLMGESAASLLSNRTTAGLFFENFVTLEILKQLSWSNLSLKAYHFSMHSGAEVDLVLEDRKKQLYGVEIKSKASVNAADFNGLKKLAALAGKKFQKGIILYTGDQVVGFGDMFKAVPVGNLW